MKILVYLFFSLLLVSPAFAQESPYEEHIVRKGDTLWDITSTSLNNPFLWPKVWKENPEIANPNRIFPGQKIRIPLKLKTEKIKPVTAPTEEVSKEEVAVPTEEKPEKAVVEKKPTYLIDRGLLYSSGYISPTLPRIGKIFKSLNGRTIFGEGDLAYLKSNNKKQPFTMGEKFIVIRPIKEVIEITNWNSLGYLVKVVGAVKVIGEDEGVPKAEVIEAFSDIDIGDRLDTYQDFEPPLAPETPRRPDISGYIVETRGLKTLNAFGDVLYLDKGAQDGINVGDVFDVALIKKGLPKRTIGMIQVISVREKTATAVIRKADQDILRGYVFWQGK